MPSIAPDDPVSLNSTGADVLMRAFATSRIYTSLTGTTEPMIRLDLRPRRNPYPDKCQMRFPWLDPETLALCRLGPVEDVRQTLPGTSSPQGA